MKTSWTEIRETEIFISGLMSPEDHLLREAKMIVAPELKFNTMLQKKIYQLVTIYARKKMKAESEKIFQALINDPHDHNFRNQINAIFKQSDK